jgi:hypothetical protein
LVSHIEEGTCMEGSIGGENEGDVIPTLRRKILLPFSWSKGRPSRQPARTKQLAGGLPAWLTLRP